MAKHLENKIILTSDHRGKNLLLFLKNKIASHFKNAKIIDTVEMFFESQKEIDYPTAAKKAVKIMNKDIENSLGIFICGSGRGMCIAANRFPKIYAATIDNPEEAKSAKQNGINVLCLGGNKHNPKTAWKITKVFITTAKNLTQQNKKRLLMLDKID